MPTCPARARQLLNDGKAAVYRRFPFTIILKHREGGEVQPVRFKVDPGSKMTGMVLVTETDQKKEVVFAAELEHRGRAIKARLDTRRAVRQSRRQRKTRYRASRFDNRCKPKGWLPPSIKSRVDNVVTWLRRLTRFVPISDVSMELVRFDTQAIRNPEISGVEYQQGTLLGYEVREYLLEKFNRRCVYCKVQGVPLQVEHIIPKVRDGTDRIDNLTLACEPCNQKKGKQTAAEFGYPEVEKRAKTPLKDIAAVNAARWCLWRLLSSFGLPIEVGTGGRTKFNRVQQSYPKAHWIDAACVGVSGADVSLKPEQSILAIKAMGRGSRQICRTDKYGFPNKHRTGHVRFFGFQTGDMVRVDIPSGKYAGVYIGRVTVRNRPKFKVDKIDVHPKRLHIIQKSDGYVYS